VTCQQVLETLYANPTATLRHKQKAYYRPDKGKKPKRKLLRILPAATCPTPDALVSSKQGNS